MKKTWIYATLLLATLSGTVACSDDEQEYPTTVIKDVELYLNGKPYSIGMSGYHQDASRILFVYRPDGSYVGSYMPHYNFALEGGAYKVYAISSYLDLIGAAGANVGELTVKQDSMADKTVMSKIITSAPTDYVVPSNEPLRVNMLSRTGTIRLRALDDDKDMSYSTVRARITTPHSVFHLADETYVGEPMETSRDKATPTGGRNYTDDFMFFPTESDDKGVSIRFEFLDDAKNVVKTKQIEGTYGVYPDSIHILQVYLNNPNDNKAYPYRPETED